MKRRDQPKWLPGTTVVRGSIVPGVFRFDGPKGRHVWLRPYAFQHVKATAAEFDLDEVSLMVAWSEFERCTFRQRAKVLGDPPPQGSLGFRPTTYRDCHFERVQFRIRAGVSVGLARFEHCTFRHCRFHEHFSFCADYVDCAFEGTIATAVFNGRGLMDACNGKVNEFRGNDFTRARLRSVGFRTGIRIEDQKWPAGYAPVVDA